MSSIVPINTVPKAAVAAPSASAGESGEAAGLDFSQLLGAGMDRIADTAAQAALPEQADIGPDAGLTTASDPAALLDAIAALPAAPDVAATPAQPPVSPAIVAIPAAATIAGRTDAPASAPSQPAAKATASIVERDLPGAGRPAAPWSARADAPSQAKRAEPQTPLVPAAADAGITAEPRIEPFELSSTQAPSPANALHHALPMHAALRETAMAVARVETLPQPVGTPEWDAGLADRVVWMAKNDVQTAELRLNPAELGPIEITLTLSGEDRSQATVQFSAVHATTREAIETALPRLREMMQESGINLGHAGVDARAGHAADSEARQQAPGRQGRSDGPAASNTSPLPAAGTKSLARGLVDTFA